MDADRALKPPTRAVLFVCLHGSAKSLIAAEHFNRMAKARGLDWRAESSGLEPDAAVPPAVVAGMASDGIDVRRYNPRLLNAAHLARASRIVSFGCDVGHVSTGGASVERWDDLPLVSDGYATARDAIVARVERLLDEV